MNINCEHDLSLDSQNVLTIHVVAKQAKLLISIIENSNIIKHFVVSRVHAQTCLRS